MKFNKGTGFILVAGIFWGSMGVFVRTLSLYGFSSIQVAAIRMVVAAVFFSIMLFFKEKKGFFIDKKDIFLFIGLGIGSVLFFAICYFTAINMMSMSVAAILLYTSPIWVMIMSVIFLKENITGRKIMALIIAFTGCVLVSGCGMGKISAFGIAAGVCSGIGYGLYSILGSIALRKYSPYVVTTYTFIIAGIGGILISNPVEMVKIVKSSGNMNFIIFFSILTGVITAVIPFLLYTLGLEKTEASRAAILATIEPVVATIFGVLVYHESLTFLSVTGILCVLASVVILNWKKS